LNGDSMKGTLLNQKDIAPACSYCLHGRLSADKQSILCVKRGIMLLTSRCRKFRYDPLKREPQKQPRLQEFRSEDFEI